MKKLIFLLIILSCLMFVGCASTVDMEYGIDADNNAYTKINIEINAADLLEVDKNTLKGTLLDIVLYYQNELDFEAKADYFVKNENKALITLKKTIPSSSFKEAFENLKGMLCDDELSIFSQLSCEISDTSGNYAYRINGRIDIHRALENSYNSGVAKGVADYVKSQLENSSFSVTLAMPDNTKIYHLSLTEPTQVSFNGKNLSQTDVLPPVISSWDSSFLDASALLLIAFVIISLTGIIIGVKLIKNGKKKDNYPL